MIENIIADTSNTFEWFTTSYHYSKEKNSIGTAYPRHLTMGVTPIYYEKTQDVIERLKRIHGDRYDDYSNIENELKHFTFNVIYEGVLGEQMYKIYGIECLETGDVYFINPYFDTLLPKEEKIAPYFTQITNHTHGNADELSYDELMPLYERAKSETNVETNVNEC